MGFRFPIQRKTAMKWIEAVRESNSKSRVVFAIRNRRDRILGVIQLHSIDWPQRKCMLGVYIGDTRERNKGIGYIACALLLDYAFNGLDIWKVGLEVLAVSTHAKRLYENLGFFKEGTKVKEYYINGVRENVDIYGLFKDSWKVTIHSGANRLIAGNAG